MKKNRSIQLVSIITIFVASSNSAFAISPIIRSFDSVSAEGMGDVRFTTGLYEENFFANPARTTENPSNLFQLPKLTIEAGSGLFTAIKDVSGGTIAGFDKTIGTPVSARVQLVFPAFYARNFITDKWSMAIGLITGFQLMEEISNTGYITPTTVVDIGPAFTIARRLLPEDRLSIGLTTHVELRGTSGSPFSIIDFLNGKADNALIGGGGVGVDFDLGTTFKPHWHTGGFDYELAFAIDNVLGGNYNNLGVKLGNWGADPIPTPRNVNFGISARRPDLWKFKSFLMALEFTDIGNNTNGSFFRTVHFGSEVQWHLLALRAGINQGYFSAGLGLDLIFMSINASTYGEEMGLNSGILEDRRYALDIGFKI